MTNSNLNISKGPSRKAAGRVSMISLLAISAGIAAAPATAQDMISPADMPMQSPVAAPAPAPTTQSAPVISAPAAKADPVSPATPARAEALATKGGFDAETVAPEALAQIETEQQARKAAAAKSAAAKSAAATRAAPVRTTSAPAATVAGTASDLAADSLNESAANDITPVAAFDNAPASQTAPAATETAATPAEIPADNDLGLLAALAALLGIGGVATYAATRGRKTETTETAAAENAELYSNNPVPPSANYAAAAKQATMPELRTARAEAEMRPASVAQPASVTAAEAAPAQRTEQGVATKVAFADFVSGVPPLEQPRGTADRAVTNQQRRVTAAPRPYLDETDLSRPAGYFTAHVDAMPTPQNPFLSRQKRLKRAKLLDVRLAEMKASNAMQPARVTEEVKDTRPLEPAYS